MPSPQHKNYQVAPRAKQEKQETETGTLFAALADAQHNAQLLRAHNLGQVFFEYIRKGLHARGEEYVHPHLNHLRTTTLS